MLQNSEFMRMSFAVSLALGLTFLSGVTVSAAEGTVPLKLNLPAHTTKGTPEDLPAGPNIEPLPKTPPPPIQVPAGVKNVAVGKPVTSSVAPYTGELSQITDEKREPLDEDVVEF